MSAPQLIQTASWENSIWRTIPEDTFRRSIIALSTKTEVPCDQRRWWSASYSDSQPPSPDPGRILSFKTERQLADDFAFIAAARPGAKGVTAVCIEESREPPGLVIRIAANEGVGMEIRGAFAHIFKCLMSCAKGGQSTITSCLYYIHAVAETKLEDGITEVSRLTLNLSRNRIMERLGNLCSGAEEALGRMRAAARTTAAEDLVTRLTELKRSLDMIQQSPRPSTDELHSIVRDSLAVVTCDGRQSLRKTLTEAGLSARDWFDKKEIMQIDKLSACHRIPRDIVRKACRKRSRGLFSNITVEYTTPYKPKRSSVAFKRQKVACYVHAEIQLIIHYMLSTSTPILPRAIGSSKGACFLCHLFITAHTGFVVTSVHGRLYDQWTIPDLAEYTPENVAMLRSIIEQMNSECLRLTRAPHVWRRYPLESRHNLRDWASSPLSSMPDMVNSLGFGQLQITDTGTQQTETRSVGEADGPTLERIQMSAGRLDEAAVQGPQLISVIETVDQSADVSRLDAQRSRSEESPKSALTSLFLLPDSLSQLHISPSTPCDIVSVPGWDIRVEIEAPGTGIVGLRDGNAVDDGLSVNVIRVDELKSGEELRLSRLEDEEALVLHLEQGGNETCRMCLQWT
ncbi:hypothetical protein EDD36DRAFT_284392 [Exophiala viscosa]|uniref:Uncharacterized protein n=1 Tax=Exophiala viscosa TaxID=2486360 RepID=A0AAN6IBH1_9EURO|nr:hypothetical protein EDD36DRAFT_284392 [Exophiala viscosa]